MSKGDRTRTRILDTAQALVLEKGFSGTSIDEIIEEAEITKGGFFYHFRGKADLARQLMARYLEQDEEIFRSLIARAESLVDDPLQRVLVFLKLYAEVMADLPGGHPGCLVASFTYESQLFDPEVRALARSGVQAWRDVFVERFVRVAQKYPMQREVSLEVVADMLTSIIEGGIIVSRVMGDPQILAVQILQFRDYVRLLFADES